MTLNFWSSTGILNLAENRNYWHGTSKQIEKKEQKLSDIMKWIHHCIKFLVTQNLASRGHKEWLQLDDDFNVRNFHSLLKLPTIFNHLMKEHITHVERHPGSISYLFIRCLEWVHLHDGIHCLPEFTKKLSQSITVSCLTWLLIRHAHCEQMSEVMSDMEVDFERKTVHVRESFPDFSQIRRMLRAWFKTS